MTKMRKMIDQPTVCNREDLMCDNEFMDKEMIREKCNCVYKNTCLALVDLLENGKIKEAEDLIGQTDWKGE